jgi:hypothetical protein
MSQAIISGGMSGIISDVITTPLGIAVVSGVVV